MRAGTKLGIGESSMDIVAVLMIVVVQIRAAAERCNEAEFMTS